MTSDGKAITQRVVAKLINISPDFFNHILHSRCVCPPLLAQKLEEVTDIDKKIWLSGTKKEKWTAWLMFQIESQGDETNDA